jgi:septal ring factor EnvC (AmiA/AmiB activator)
MSEYNQSNPTANTPKKNNSIIYWVVILVLLAACLYLFVSKNKMASDNDMQSKMMMHQMDSVKTDRASLQTDFDAASAKIDQLVSQNSKLDSALQGDKAKMAKMQAEIRSILSNKNATQAELKKARQLITTLTDKTRDYETRIAELEKENTQLTGQNQTLTKQVDSTSTVAANLKKVASVLHASNLRMEPIHKKRNGKEMETTKARKVDVLRIMFDIDQNHIAESGNKALYVRIITPDNKVLSSASNASGMMDNANGGQLSYSVMKSVALTQNVVVKDVTVDWNQDGDYPKGSYIIEIYNEGYKVGNGTVTLK